MIVLSSSLAPTIAILVLVLALFASVIIYLIYLLEDNQILKLGGS